MSSAAEKSILRNGTQGRGEAYQQTPSYHALILRREPTLCLSCTAQVLRTSAAWSCTNRSSLASGAPHVLTHRDLAALTKMTRKGAWWCWVRRQSPAGHYHGIRTGLRPWAQAYVEQGWRKDCAQAPFRHGPHGEIGFRICSAQACPRIFRSWLNAPGLPHDGTRVVLSLFPGSTRATARITAADTLQVPCGGSSGTRCLSEHACHETVHFNRHYFAWSSERLTFDETRGRLLPQVPGKRADS